MIVLVLQVSPEVNRTSEREHKEFLNVIEKAVRLFPDAKILIPRVTMVSTKEIYEAIRSSDLVICDVTRSADVMFYLGYASALRKPTILIARHKEGIPSVADRMRLLFYPQEFFQRELVEAIDVSLRDQKRFDIRPHPRVGGDPNGILEIPLRSYVRASELGLLLQGLTDLYSVAHEVDGKVNRQIERAELVANRISVGTPNVAELIGILPQITAIAAALVAVMRVPKAIGEGAREIAEARKKWIEGNLLREQLSDDSGALVKPGYQRLKRVASSFDSLTKARNVILAEPTVKIDAAGGSASRITSSENRKSNGRGNHGFHLSYLEAERHRRRGRRGSIRFPRPRFGH